MPIDGVPNELLDRIEDYIAEIHNGRDACTELELFTRAQLRRGNISQEEARQRLDQIDTIRLAIKRGQWFGKKVRGSPSVV